MSRKGWNEEANNVWTFRLADGTPIIRMRKHRGEEGKIIIIIQTTDDKVIKRFDTSADADAWINGFKARTKKRVFG